MKEFKIERRETYTGVNYYELTIDEKYVKDLRDAVIERVEDPSMVPEFTLKDICELMRDGASDILSVELKFKNWDYAESKRTYTWDLAGWLEGSINEDVYDNFVDEGDRDYYDHEDEITRYDENGDEIEE